MNLDSKRAKAIFSLIFFLPLLTLLYNLERIVLGQMHASDTGIYQQAILDLAFSPSWNPYNTIRGAKIFSDHFDPIILIPAALMRFSGPNVWLPHVYDFLLYWLGGFFILFITRKKPLIWRIFATSVWLFNDGLLTALRFHIHPTTESMFSILLLAYFLRERRFGMILLLSNILCLHKEYYPFCILTLGCAFLLRKSLREGSILVLNALIWIGFDFYLREKIMGSVVPYGGHLLSGVIADPVQGLLSVFSRFDWKPAILTMFPTVVGVWITMKTGKDKAWMGTMLLFIAPVFLIQFISGTIGFHYGAPLYATLLSVIALSDGEWLTVPARAPRPVLIFLWLTLIYAAGDSVLRSKDAFAYAKETDKKAEFGQARDFIAKLPADQKILATGGLIPVVIQPNQKIYALRIYSVPQDHYDVVLLGRCNSSDIYPLSCDELKTATECFKAQASEMVMDTKEVWMAKGSFDKTCGHGVIF